MQAWKKKKLKGSVGEEGKCGDEVEVLLVREISSLEILAVKKLAKLWAREEPGAEASNGEEDLRWSRLLTVFHRCFVLSETEETKLEKYCFFWKWGSIYGIGYGEIWKKTYVEQSVCISRGFQHDEQLM